MVSDKEKRIRRLVWAAKVITLIGVLVFIYLKIKDQPETIAQILPEIQRVTMVNQFAIGLVVLLMPFNWLLESYKWKMLTKPIKAISLKSALKGVLSGLSLAFITPHGIGDYIGRIAMIKSENRSRLVGSLLLGRGMQMFVTLLFGLIGVYFVLGWSVFMTLGVIALIGLVILLLITKVKVISKSNWLKKLLYYFDIISEFDFAFVFKLLFVSALRYVVFATQFIIVLGLFVETSILQNLAGTTWILLAKSVLPAFNFLSDLGVREVSAIYFYESYNVELVSVLSASLTVWIINILAPTLIGLPFVLQLKHSPK